ncbi:MAG: hypothetical protein PVH00_08600 [Gemmatimonadota bacterium]|jgi:hypothetical protein
MALIAVHRASSTLIRLALAAAFVLPPTGGMPAGAVPVAGVIYGCPMGGHEAGGGDPHRMHAAAGHRAVDPRGTVERGPAGADDDGCHCCRDCGCPAAAEAATAPSVDVGLRPAIIARLAHPTPIAFVSSRTPRALLPPPTGPPALFA